ncbi:MAG TPA: SMP-30/gluconolactonase/LRE family protein, partial [Paracoccaceae bacterium]|nr:SMP-30/gluconolactonase/LRE family protein [Paracoccaceae bacterium]
MTAQVFDPRLCTLGEGPLWHPERNQLFWFDILGKRLLSRDETGPLTWQFDEHVSAAGWVDRDTLLIASETALFRFTLSSGVREDIVALEADNPQTRSNDGRADPWGGFWIGTMGNSAQPDAGAIYRFYKGGVTKLFD